MDDLVLLGQCSQDQVCSLTRAECHSQEECRWSALGLPARVADACGLADGWPRRPRLPDNLIFAQSASSSANNLLLIGFFLYFACGRVDECTIGSAHAQVPGQVLVVSEKSGPRLRTESPGDFFRSS